MKTLLLLLLCGQFTVEVFTEPKIVRPTFTVDVVVESIKSPQKKYLAFFTSSSCGPCQGWKRRQKKELERMGYTVREYEMTDSTNQTKYKNRLAGGYPAFVVCDWETGAWLSEPVHGGIEVSTAVAMLGEITLEKASLVLENAVVTQPAVTYPASQSRYYSYNGRQYDLETYRRCSLNSCGMCIEIINAQQRYFESNRLINKVGPQAASSDDVVQEALSLMNLKPESVFCDLGCGDGSVMIKATQRSGCRCIGVEIDPIKVKEARHKIAGLGLSHRIEVIEGDVREFRPAHHQVTHVYAYLYEDLLKEIAGTLQSVDVAVCPGHECPDIGMKLVGQCWIRRREDEQVQGISG